MAEREIGLTSWTPAQLDEAAQLLFHEEECRFYERPCDCGWAAVSVMLRHGAAALRTLEGQTCETCRFAGEPEELGRHCFRFDISTQVPLTVNGQPFGCRGWSAKETQ